MSRQLKRIRGWLLRLAHNRGAAVLAGLALLAPAAALQLAGSAAAPWWVDAVALTLAATGAALVLVGLSGRRPDWIDPERGQGPG
jgi:hypothetical protein